MKLRNSLIVSLLVGAAVGIGVSGSALSSQSDQDVETLENGVKIKILKEKPTQRITDELVNGIWESIESFNKDGGYYFEGDIVHIGVKDDANVEKLDSLNSKKGMPSNIKIAKVAYSFDELEVLKGEVNTELANNGLDAYSVEAVMKSQKVTVEIPVIAQDKREILEKHFGDKIKIVTNYEQKELPERKFIDVPNGIWFEEAVQFLQRKGIASGNHSDEFLPEESILRQDAMSMAYRAIGATSIYRKIPEMTKVFADQEEVSLYADKAIKYFESTGSISGYPDGSILPRNSITRAEAAMFLSRAFSYKLNQNAPEGVLTFEDINEDDYYKRALEILVDADVVSQSEDGEFRPDEEITRAEFASFLYRLCK